MHHHINPFTHSTYFVYNKLINSRKLTCPYAGGSSARITCHAKTRQPCTLSSLTLSSSMRKSTRLPAAVLRQRAAAYRRLVCGRVTLPPASVRARYLPAQNAYCRATPWLGCAEARLLAHPIILSGPEAAAAFA